MTMFILLYNEDIIDQHLTKGVLCGILFQRITNQNVVRRVPGGNSEIGVH